MIRFVLPLAALALAGCAATAASSPSSGAAAVPTVSVPPMQEVIAHLALTRGC